MKENLLLYFISGNFIILTGCLSLGSMNKNISSTTVLKAEVNPSEVKQGDFFKVRFNWKAKNPLDDDYSIFE